MIVCGDFNSIPDSSVLSLILNQKDFVPNRFCNKDVRKAYEKVWSEYAQNKDINDIKGYLSSAYSHYRVVENNEEMDEFKLRMKRHPGFTNFTSCYHGTLDYIFHSER